MANGQTIVFPLNRSVLSLLALASILFFNGALARAQQFSADLVAVKGDGAAEPAGQLRVAGDHVRIETPELTDGFFVIDGAKPVAVFVRPAARLFMDARQSSRLTRIFVPVDPDNPCGQWEAMSKLAGIADQGDWRCERVGAETIDGNSVVAYRAIPAPGREFFGWIDPARKFPLQIKTEDGIIITARNVRDEPQPAQLFEIPPGSRKFDPAALIQRIKQSDVWVDDKKDPDPSHR
ncbi:hypothetical protein [Bradyrhizobium sp. dw_78]|uniref:hypothetical protein n=1 Tax=Bradyrhizobium sp. dw_78 TaxID=2719793 RepID=UPI001BD5E92D|nr:hypothetical protein [Bradyrhizobium sp. dw_78]